MFHPLKVSLSVQLIVNSILTNHNARSSSVIVINTDEPRERGRTHRGTNTCVPCVSEFSVFRDPCFGAASENQP